MYPRLSERDGLVIVEFSPSALGIAARPISSERYEPIALSDVMWQDDVLAAIDGPMFGNCDPGSTYATSHCADPRYAQLDRSVSLSDPPNAGNDTSGVSVSIVDGMPIWSLGGSFDPRSTVGVQMYPTLVADGVVSSVSTSGSNAQRVRRMALGQMANGNLAFIYGTDSLAGFARRCREAGAVWAGYTDGGGSASLGYRDALTGTVRRFGVPEASERRVAVFLVARRPSVVGETLKTAGAGLAIGVVGLGLAALSVFAYDRWKRSQP